MDTRLLLSDGEFLYSNALGAEERAALRERIASGEITMRCSCRLDEELLYGVSVDNRIIPLHQHYEHAAWCSRKPSETRQEAILYDEAGMATVYLGFNPLNFTPPKEKDETEQEEVVSVDVTKNEEDDGTSALPTDNAIKKDKEKLPTFSLRGLVKRINRDAYSARLMQGKSALLSEEYFYPILFGSLKNVYVNGVARSLRALTLDEDHTCFFYSRLESVEDSGIVLRGSKGSYRRFVPEKILMKARDEFASCYGRTIEDAMAEVSVYVAGFAYRRVSRQGNMYTCGGRLCFFVVTRNGLYVESMFEKDVLEAVTAYTHRCGGVFLFPDSDRLPYYGILRIPKQRKEGVIYLKNGPSELMKGAKSLCCKDVPTEEVLERFVLDICST